jgi:hypothetical protein
VFSDSAFCVHQWARVSLDDLTQLGTIGLDNEVDREAVAGPRLVGPDDGHQYSSGSNQACGRFPMSPPMTSNTRSTSPTSSKGVVVEVDELLRAEVERRRPASFRRRTSYASAMLPR